MGLPKPKDWLVLCHILFLSVRMLLYQYGRNLGTTIFLLIVPDKMLKTIFPKRPSTPNNCTHPQNRLSLRKHPYNSAPTSPHERNVPPSYNESYNEKCDIDAFTKKCSSNRTILLVVPQNASQVTRTNRTFFSLSVNKVSAGNNTNAQRIVCFFPDNVAEWMQSFSSHFY